MALITVDMEKCIRCGACVDVCPGNILGMGAQGPEKTGERTCISCGHCVAVCPVGALDNRKNRLAKQVELNGFAYPAAEEMEKILRFRRSCRAYQDKLVPAKDIEKLLDVARHAPTGGNSQGLSFLVFTGREKLDAFVEAVICWMEHIIKTDGPRADYFTGVVGNYRNEGIDSILRGVRQLIVAIAPDAHRGPRDNCAFVWAYAELFAPSMGLGTCIAGFVQGCAFAGWQPLLELMDIHPGMQVGGALMVGYPCYGYKRLVARQPLLVEFR